MRVATYNQQNQGGFLNASGVLTDPTAVTLKIADPTGQVTTPAAIRDSTGFYHYDVDTTAKPGLWTYEWIGTGVVQAIAANQFKVIPAPI